MSLRELELVEIPRYQLEHYQRLERELEAKQDATKNFYRAIWKLLIARGYECNKETPIREYVSLILEEKEAAEQQLAVAKNLIGADKRTAEKANDQRITAERERDIAVEALEKVQVKINDSDKVFPAAAIHYRGVQHEVVKIVQQALTQIT